MVQKLEIKGGIPLAGEVSIGGAKNAALPALAASLLTEEEVVIKNLPEVRDVDTMLQLLEYMGVSYERESDSVVRMKAGAPSEDVAPYEMVKKMRASVLVLGPLTARYGEARVSLPGGCAIGVRPINLHLDGLKKLGAEIEIDHGYVQTRCKILKGAEIEFEQVTVTGTENLMMAATLAEGRTLLDNCAIEPEVTDLANMLVKMGAKIDGIGTRRLVIDGVDKLNGIDYEVIPDRIETGTYIVAGLITGGEITVTNCCPKHLEEVLKKMKEANAVLEIGEDYVRVKHSPELKGTNIKTIPYPGFPTDMQAQFMALMTRAQGTSVITENIFENRFMHVAELVRFGADIVIDGHTAVVRGPSKLIGAHVMATDLRASAGLLLAGLAAENTTVVHRVYHLDRGYEKICRKLGGLGARIKRVP
ncbi:MAG: UDP-N-acetylglucosamine 1-carboxyvinyltransferase [Acidobacteria bacterium]|nr:UDP-N-acetylglucosamine 1-carboxyvinyltransferase [Acidobacteriota bacterium]